MSSDFVERDGQLWFVGDIPEQRDDDIMVMMTRDGVEVMTRRELRQRIEAGRPLAQGDTENEA